MCDKRVLLAVGAVLAVAGVYAAGTLWRASRALRTSAVEIEREGRIPFTSTALDPRVPAGFESLPIPPGFRDAIIFGDHIFIAGGGGLFEYDASGVEVARFRTGLELPAAPVVALAVGAGGGSGVPELWMATDGEGALAFDGARFRHLVAPLYPSSRNSRSGGTKTSSEAIRSRSAAIWLWIACASACCSPDTRA